MLKKIFCFFTILFICTSVANAFGKKIDPWQYSGNLSNLSSYCVPIQPSSFSSSSPSIIPFIILGIIILYDIGIVFHSYIKGRKENSIKRTRLGFISGIFTVAIMITSLILPKVFESTANELFFVTTALLQIALAITVLAFSIKNSLSSGKTFGLLNLMLVALPLIYFITSSLGSMQITVLLFGYALLLGIHLIRKGIKTENDKMKFLGKVVLVLLFAALSLLISMQFVNNTEMLLLVAFLIQIVFIIFSLVYSFKNKIRSGKIYNAVIIPLIICMVFQTVAPIFEPFNQTSRMGGVSMQLNCATDSAMSMSPSFLGDMSSNSISNFKSSNTIGFSVGGAKDINNFRENIKNGFLPLLSDVTYEGLFYDYYFDTGKAAEKNEMFYPSYSYAISKDPLSGEQEHFLSVGLNSNIKESDFSRKKLNLVIVMDISGSMGSSFDSYYYDGNSSISKLEPSDANKTKMQIADEAVNILIDQLKDTDTFGLVLFSDSAEIASKLTKIENTDVKKLKEHILTIAPTNGTNFEAGYNLGTSLFNDKLNINKNEFENRIIVITDAMPNIGSVSSSELLNNIKKNAKNNINTTFVGVGVDFNTDLIETISTVRGANYYSVHNSSEFKERMGEQFEYMVTPLVYDLKMELDSKGFEIAAVYGTNEADKATGEIMYVNTLFPSKSDSNGEVKGGIILLKLKKLNNENKDLSLTVSYEDRSGDKHTSSESIIIPEVSDEHYQNTGIRKGILLTRYVNLLKNWVMFEKSNNKQFILDDDMGITDFDLSSNEITTLLNGWERQSVPLKVSGDYKKTFETFKSYMGSEIKELNDTTLDQEVTLLEKLI